MTVTLTSPVLGKNVGDTHTGPEEPWLLAQGYARQDGYTGPGVSNTGLTATTPANDPTLAANREDPPEVDSETGIQDPGPADPAMTFTTTDDDPTDPDVDYDFDAGGVNTEAPTVLSIEPVTGAAGDSVVITGRNFDGATSAAVGGVNLVGFEAVSDTQVAGELGAHADGLVDVTVTNPTGTGTKVGAFTYDATP